MEIYNTHKFLFTLHYENRIKGHKIKFIDRDNEEKTIEVDRLEIGASTVSCKIFDSKGNRHLVPFLKIREIYLEDELVWDSKEVDISNIKVIKGYE